MGKKDKVLSVRKPLAKAMPSLTITVVSVAHAPLEVVADAVEAVRVRDGVVTLAVALLDAAVAVRAAP